MDNAPELRRQGLVTLTQQEVAPLREAMLDLQVAVAQYYAQTATGADLGPAVRRFLVAAQTLNELLRNAIEAKETFLELFSQQRHPLADVMDGIKFARNVNQHVLHVVKPSDKFTLVGGALGMRIYCDWDSIPGDVVDRLHPRTRALEPAYVKVLEGKPVLATMLRALRFYAEVSPLVIHRDSRGEWTGFPLMNQPGMNTPLHPEEPDNPDESIRWMNSRRPGGDCRVVCGQVTIEGVAYLYGHTFVGRYSFAPFVETEVQVNADISLGYRYLEGDLATHVIDVSHQFPDVRQGPVLQSSNDLDVWTTTFEPEQTRVDWCAPGVDEESWARFVRMEVDPAIPRGFIFSARRARRLNALVPYR